MWCPPVLKRQTKSPCTLSSRIHRERFFEWAPSLEQKGSHYLQPPDLSPWYVSASMASPSGMYRFIRWMCIMLAGIDMVDAHYALWIRPALVMVIVLSLTQCEWVRRMHCSLVKGLMWCLRCKNTEVFCTKPMGRYRQPDTVGFCFTHCYVHNVHHNFALISPLIST